MIFRFLSIAEDFHFFLCKLCKEEAGPAICLAASCITFATASAFHVEAIAAEPEKQPGLAKPGSRQSVKLPPKKMLVPPPPPVAASSAFMVSPLSFKYSEFAGIMTEGEGRRAMKRLEVQLERTRSEVNEFKSQLEEHKNKSEKFQELYSEGVISKRELEASRRDVDAMSRDMKLKMEELEELEYQYKRISSLFPVKKTDGLNSVVKDNKQKK